MAELCFNQTCVFNPLDNVSFTSWGFICPHDKLLLSTCIQAHTGHSQMLGTETHESGKHFKIVDYNENFHMQTP